MIEEEDKFENKRDGVIKVAVECVNLTDKPVTVCQELFEKIQIKKA